MKLEIKVEAEFLSIRMAGMFTLEEAKSSFMSILDAVIRNKMERVLVDCRDLVGEPSTLERYHYGEFAAKAVMHSDDPLLTRRTWFVYILKPPMLDPQRLGETVAVNRGMLVKVFDNLESAFEWLKITPVNAVKINVDISND